MEPLRARAEAETQLQVNDSLRKCQNSWTVHATGVQAATLQSQAKQAELEVPSTGRVVEGDTGHSCSAQAWQQKHAASSAEVAQRVTAKIRDSMKCQVVQLRARLAEVEEELKAWGLRDNLRSLPHLFKTPPNTDILKAHFPGKSP